MGYNLHDVLENSLEYNKTKECEILIFGGHKILIIFQVETLNM
jgi:hypothetical protein